MSISFSGALTLMDDRLFLPVLLAILSIVLSLVGWTMVVFDGSMSGVAEVMMRVILAFIPAVERLQGGNLLTQIGAIFGALTTLFSAILVLVELLQDKLARSRLKYSWRGHAIVVGDSDLARRVCAAIRGRQERVVQVVAKGAAADLEGGWFRVPLGPDIGSIHKHCGLARAAHVIIDLSSDLETLSFGRRLRAARGPGEGSTLALCVKDSVLADHLDDIFGLGQTPVTLDAALPSRPILFDENRVIARTILEREPLFVQAGARGQSRVHALIVGFGDLGEKLLDQVMLTCLAGDLEAPRVTVADRNAARLEQEFRVRRPRVLDDLAIDFIPLDVTTDLLETHRQAGLTRLLDLARENEVTAIFVCLSSSLDVARTTLLLRQFHARSGALLAPIFVRTRGAGTGTEILESLGKTNDPRDRVISMDLSASILLDQTANPKGVDALARALHECYLQGEARSEQGSKAWELLPETLHRANIRAADHLRAKLWTLGFDISNWPAGVIPTLNEPGRRWLFGEGTPSGEARERLEHLARQEHERWVIDRKLDGWARADRRDNAQRLHPLLAPWAELRKSANALDKDVAQVTAALRFVVENGSREHALNLEFPPPNTVAT